MEMRSLIRKGTKASDLDSRSIHMICLPVRILIIKAGMERWSLHPFSLFSDWLNSLYSFPDPSSLPPSTTCLLHPSISCLSSTAVYQTMHQNSLRILPASLLLHFCTDEPFIATFPAGDNTVHRQRTLTSPSVSCRHKELGCRFGLI